MATTKQNLVVRIQFQLRRRGYEDSLLEWDSSHCECHLFYNGLLPSESHLPLWRWANTSSNIITILSRHCKSIPSAYSVSFYDLFSSCIFRLHWIHNWIDAFSFTLLKSQRKWDADNIWKSYEPSLNSCRRVQDVKKHRAYL